MLPPCFEEDYECQSVSNDREKLVAVIVFTVIFIVIIATVSIFTCYRKRVTKKQNAS